MIRLNTLGIMDLIVWLIWLSGISVFMRGFVFEERRLWDEILGNDFFLALMFEIEIKRQWKRGRFL
jgi:hypothetical protein